MLIKRTREARKHTVAIVTNGSGDGTGYTNYFSGLISSVQYVKTNFADGVDFTITLDATGETIWADTDVNASEVVRPRAATHTTAGVAALYAASGAVNDHIAAGRDRVKIVVGSGGDTKTGTFVITVEED